MEDVLKRIIEEYIENIDCVCISLLEGLNLKTKAEFWEFRATNFKMQQQYEINGIKYIFHGNGCIAINGKRFLDWDFGYGSRWCGVNPSLLAGTLKNNKIESVQYYSSEKIKIECEQAILDGQMYKKNNLYYFSIPLSETFEPRFPKEFDTLVVEHFDSQWRIPRNKMVDKFLRKSKRVYKQIEKNYDLYTLRFILNDKEIFSIPFNDIGYSENAVKIMNEILINTKRHF